MFGLARKNPLPRKFKVDRGTAARVARDLGLSAVHVGYVIKGVRVPSTALFERLETEEYEQAKKG